MMEEAYKNYRNKASMSNDLDCLVKQEDGSFLKEMRLYTQEEFINKIKTDDEFAKKWGVKVEVRELSLYDRTKILVSRSDNKKDFYDRNGKLIVEEKLVLDEYKIPAKLISFTYNNETIEIYE